MVHRLPVIVALACAFVSAAAGTAYHDFDAVAATLKQRAAAHAEVELLTIGKSAGGRPLLVARVAAAGGENPDIRPAVFVGANIAGYHNAGSEAALHVLTTLLDGKHGELLARTTFYVAPALNPDAHDGMLGALRRRITGNATRIDRDLDGLVQEDGTNDLNGDGRITRLRIADPRGTMLPNPDDPREMIEADPLKGHIPTHRVLDEGFDDDGDGEWNEDGAGGVVPDKSFAHAYRYDDPEAGPWPGYAPEARALMDFLLERSNVALAVVFGPANNLLATPRSLGGGGDTGSLKFKVPRFAAEMLGFDPEQEYTLDEIWEVAQTLPFVVQNNVTKEQLAQFLGAGPATKPDDADLKYLEDLAEAYKKRLDDAGLDSKREGQQYGRGGLTPWLYYQYGAMALELDVWGIPKPKQDKPDGGDKLTLDSLAEMSADEFLALGEEKIVAFLQEIKAPPQLTAQAVMQRVESGQVTPKQMAEMAKRMGASAGGDAEQAGPSDRMLFIDAQAPEAFVPWTEVTLPDGTRAEVGGVDPFVDVAPPPALLEPALGVHTETVLDLAGKLARVEILELKATDLGGGVHRVEAVAGNRGFLPTHTKLAERGRFHLPLRLEIATGEGVELVTGTRWTTSERLERTGRLTGEWLVRTGKRGGEITVELISDNAGRDRRSLVLGGNKR